MSVGDARADWEARIGRRTAEARDIELPQLPTPAWVHASAGRAQVTLDWEPVEGAAGYLVLRSDSRDGPFEEVRTGEPNAPAVPHPPFTDTTGAPGRAAWYRVAPVASVDDRNQARSEPVEATPTGDGPASVELVVDAAWVMGPVSRPWRPIVGAEHLSQLEYDARTGGRPVGEEFFEALRRAHDELGVEAVRAHAILHDELGVYRELDGQAQHDFSAIHRVYDRVLETGLRPVVEIGYMPRDLARDRDATVFEYRAIISPPKDWGRWEDLVRELVASLVQRYGRDELRRWGFEVWNEANLEVFWSGTRDEYLQLYDVTARAVKAVDPTLPVGGPASAAAGWIDELLAHVDASSAPIDFVSTHTYGNAPLDLRPIVARHGRPGVPLWWTEWGAHASHFAELHDSVWAGAFVVRGMRSAMGRIESLAHWTVSDHFEELGRPPRLLHGGFGLLSVGNLRKPKWWGLWMLEQLGTERLSASARGDGAGDMVDLLAARQPDGRVSVLSWNATLDHEKWRGEPLLDRDVSLRVEGLHSGRYRLRQRRLDAAHSNLAAVWQRMGGGREWPDEAGWQALHEADRLEELEPVREVQATDQPLQLSFVLPMPSVDLIELEPIG